MTKESRITVRFPSDLRRRLREAARRTHRRESDVIRQAVEKELAAEEDAPTAYELFRKAGLIGIIKSAPRDLSTNPKYFDGFGKS